jgi:hypothetical protein
MLQQRRERGNVRRSPKHALPDPLIPIRGRQNAVRLFPEFRCKSKTGTIGNEVRAAAQPRWRSTGRSGTVPRNKHVCWGSVFMSTSAPGAASRLRASRLLCIFAVSSAAVLAGCGTQYGQLGVTGGFTDKMISNDAGVIVVSGNGFTSSAKVESMLLLRASEMTLQSGHQRFSLLTIEDQAALDAQKAGRLPAYLREKATGGAPKPRLVTERTTVTSYPSGASFDINKSGGGFFVVMFKGSGGAYDARKLAAELRPKLQAASNEKAAADGATTSQ